MLTAKRNDGILFTLPEELSPEMLIHIKSTEPYYCPCCQTELILKAGSIKIPHFAHKRNSACDASSESESPYHLLAKRKLFNWFISNGYQAELEAYLPDIKKRADILVFSGNKSYAIEFQCSTISESTFIERTEAYLSVSITPVWILAAKHIKRLGVYEFKLSDFQWLFVTGDIAFPFLWAYCPEKNQLFAIKGITPFLSSIVIAEITSASLEKLHPKQMIPQRNKNFSIHANSIWKEKRKKWCQNRVKTANINHPFFLALYRNRLPVAYLPIEMGLPVKGMVRIKTSAIEWQTWLYLDVLYKREPGQVVLLQAFYQSFKKRLSLGHIKLRSLPLCRKKEDPIQEYVLFLVMAGYLKETTAGCYKLVKKLSVPRTMDEQEIMEKLFYLKCKWMLEQGIITYNEEERHVLNLNNREN